MVIKAWNNSAANSQWDRSITIYGGGRREACPAALSSLNLRLPTQNQTTSTWLHVFVNRGSGDVSIAAVRVNLDNKLI